MSDDTSEGREILEHLRQLVEQSTWVVHFRETLPLRTMYRGWDPVSARNVVIAHPADRDAVLAGLRTLNVPHELAEETPDGA